MEEYRKVSCLFYDQLTDLIVQKKYVRIDFTTDIKEFIKRQTVLKDIVTIEKQEFLMLNTGESVRLDRIKKVDGIIPPHVKNDYYQCDC